MKCPYCNESLGIYAKNTKKSDKDQPQRFCPHCGEAFRLGYSGIAMAVVIIPVVFIALQILDGFFQQVIAMGLSYALAVAIVLRAEKIDLPIEEAEEEKSKNQEDGD